MTVISLSSKWEHVNNICKSDNFVIYRIDKILKNIYSTF